MTVVRLLWEQLDRVRLSAARLNEVKEGRSKLTAWFALGEERRSDVLRAFGELKQRAGG